jgi:hypothetical protein
MRFQHRLAMATHLARRNGPGRTVALTTSRPRKSQPRTAMQPSGNSHT